MTPDRNEALAQQINRETLANPASPYYGECIGIVGGQAVVVAETLDEMARQLDELNPDRSDSAWIEAGRDYDEPVYIWSAVDAPNGLAVAKRSPDRAGQPTDA